MARTQANVYLTIWADPDFRTLSPDAQWLYFVMLTHESLNYCGVMDWRPARLASMTVGMTVERVESAAFELGQRHMIAVDEVTEEALVRSFVRHDGVLKQPNPTRGMVREFGGIASLKIMELVAREVRRAFDEHPEWKGFEEAAPVRKQFSEPFVNAFEWVPNRFKNGAANPSDLVPNRFDLGSDFDTPKKAEPFDLGSSTSTSTSTKDKSLSLSPADDHKPEDNDDDSPKLKETRLPNSWAPTSEHVERARKLGLNLTEQVEAFRSHAETHDRHAARWNAAFTTWLKKAPASQRSNVTPINAKMSPAEQHRLQNPWMYR